MSPSQGVVMTITATDIKTFLRDESRMNSIRNAALARDKFSAERAKFNFSFMPLEMRNYWLFAMTMRFFLAAKRRGASLDEELADMWRPHLEWNAAMAEAFTQFVCQNGLAKSMKAYEFVKYLTESAVNEFETVVKAAIQSARDRQSKPFSGALFFKKISSCGNRVEAGTSVENAPEELDLTLFAPASSVQTEQNIQAAMEELLMLARELKLSSKTEASIWFYGQLRQMTEALGIVLTEPQEVRQGHRFNSAQGIGHMLSGLVEFGIVAQDVVARLDYSYKPGPLESVVDGFAGHAGHSGAYVYDSTTGRYTQ